MARPTDCLIILQLVSKGDDMKPKSDKIFATLVRGQDYLLSGRNGDKDTLFVQGSPVEITPDQHEWLRVHAVDRITVLANEADELEVRGGYYEGEKLVGKDVQKFRFSTEVEQAA